MPSQYIVNDKKMVELLAFLQSTFLLRTRNLKNKSSLSKQIFMAILKWRNSSIQRRLGLAWVYYIRIARRVCAGGSERIKTLILGVRKKINKLFAGLGLVRIVKNCDHDLENSALGLRPLASFSRPQFFTLRTSQPANNKHIYHLWFYLPNNQTRFRSNAKIAVVRNLQKV